MRHANYWSNSKFSGWLRKLANAPKPTSATLTEWDEWRTHDKAAHPYLHWFVEDFLAKAQDAIFCPGHLYNEVRLLVRRRLVDRPYILDTKLPRSGYYDLDTRILHAIFESLVDFVEVELAWMHVVISSENRKRFKVPQTKWIRPLRWFAPWRCPEAGIARLDWEASLDGPSLAEWDRAPEQAAKSREIKALYHWWKTERPSRIDPHEASGWTRLTDGIPLQELLDGTKRSDITSASNIATDLERQYQEEDDAMLIRLIKIRRGLWT